MAEVSDYRENSYNLTDHLFQHVVCYLWLFCLV